MVDILEVAALVLGFRAIILASNIHTRGRWLLAASGHEIEIRRLGQQAEHCDRVAFGCQDVLCTPVANIGIGICGFRDFAKGIKVILCEEFMRFASFHVPDAVEGRNLVVAFHNYASLGFFVRLVKPGVFVVFIDIPVFTVVIVIGVRHFAAPGLYVADVFASEATLVTQAAYAGRGACFRKVKISGIKHKALEAHNDLAVAKDIGVHIGVVVLDTDLMAFAKKAIDEPHRLADYVSV
jgi:hypothetical protein